MSQSDSAACTSFDVPAPTGLPSALMVMTLRAAEQHVLVVVGEADLHTADQLRAQIIGSLPEPPLSVLVELAGLDFCDLLGLDALHDAARAARAAGVALTFRGMSRQLSWLDHAFPRHSAATSAAPDASRRACGRSDARTGAGRGPRR